MLVVLADDHAVVRRGIREILLRKWPTAQFLEAADGKEVLTAIRSHHCSLVLLDIHLPGRSGMDVLRDIKHLFPALPVLMLSVQPEDQYAIRCLRAEASGYLNKASPEEELIKAVQKVLSGGRYISESLSERLVTELQHATVKQPHELLSDRELEVVIMIAGGKSLTEIADQLHVSIKTISTYRSRSLLKMQMQNNAELTRYALEHTLIA